MSLKSFINEDDEHQSVDDKADEKIRNLQKQDALKPDNWNAISTIGTNTFPRQTTKNSPNIFKPNDGSTPEQILNDYMASQRLLKDPEFLTVNNIKEKLFSSGRTTTDKIPGSTKKIDVPLNTSVTQKSYLESLIDQFTMRPSSKDYPVILIPDVDKFKKSTGFKTETSIATDFAEVLAPVALLTDNLNGNAGETVKKFFGVKAFDKNVVNSASINFKPATNGAMIDSIINYNGKNVSISSKTNGGRGASLSGLKNAMVEIKQNTEAVKMLQKVLATNEQYDNMYEFLLLVTGETSKFDQTFEALSYFFPGDFENDLAIAKNQDKEKQISESAWEKFSKELKQIYSGYYDFKKKNPGSKIKPIPTMKQLRQGLTWAIATKANSDPYFSEMATWIFNHGAVIQVDATTNTGPNAGLKTGEDKNTILLTNFTGTWPSQCVETIELVEDDTDSFLNRLHVNGFKKQFRAGNEFRFDDPNADYTQWVPGKEGLPNRTYDIDDTVKRSTGEFSRVKTRSDWQDPNLGASRKWTANPLGGKGNPVSLGISRYQAFQYADLSDEELKALGIPEYSDTMLGIKSARAKAIELSQNPLAIDKLEKSTATPGTSMGYIRNMYDQQNKNEGLQKLNAIKKINTLKVQDPKKYNLLVQQSGVRFKKSTKEKTPVKQQPIVTQTHSSPAIQALFDFGNKYNQALHTKAKAIGVAIAIARDIRKIVSNNPEFHQDFKTLVSHPEILKMISAETRKLLSSLQEATVYNEDELNDIITAFYWAFKLNSLKGQEHTAEYQQTLRTFVNLIKALGANQQHLGMLDRTLVKESKITIVQSLLKF